MTRDVDDGGERGFIKTQSFAVRARESERSDRMGAGEFPYGTIPPLVYVLIRIQWKRRFLKIMIILGLFF